MRRPSPLPEPIAGRIFTTAEALRHGVTRGRLQAGDLTNLGRGLWLPENVEPTRASLARAIAAETEGGWVSHSTAAELMRIRVPVDDDRVHVSRPRGKRAPQRDGVCGHQRNVEPDEIMQLRGTPVSAPPRIWLEMGQYLDERELVILGDQLVRVPRASFEGRSHPWTTSERLAELLDRHARTRGAEALRRALPRIRVGSDSVAETLCRLALADAGLPAPELQFRLRPGDVYSPTADLAFPEFMLVLQYEGEHHFTPEQQARDQRRDAEFEAAGWTTFKVNKHDLREGFRSLIRRVWDVVRRSAAAA